MTLDAVVRELLRPLLKDWLDEHLPTIVEEKVQAEVDRVARRRV
jgi:cell pole-organizing protein PopZ